jgi:hypothetical protein
MDILAWVIGVLFAIILFGIVVGGILVLIEWILDLKHKRI